eukprot:gene22728-27093_t
MPPSPPKGPLRCAACGRDLPVDDFSRKQLHLQPRQRCKGCLAPQRGEREAVRRRRRAAAAT